MTRLLETYTYGAASAAPSLLVVHGLFGAARNWRGISKRLAKNRKVLAVDMRNHGDSFWDDSQTYVDMANDLAAVIRNDGGPCDVLGHSMGGKATMVLADRHPELVNKMIVADIAPVPYPHSKSAEITAMKAIDLGQVVTRSDIERALEPNISTASERSFFALSVRMNEDPKTWSLNLDALSRNMEAIVGFPGLKSSFTSKTLFLRGGNSDYVLDSSLPLLERHYSDFKIETLGGAGHWIHAEAPRAFIASVETFLETD